MVKAEYNKAEVSDLCDFITKTILFSQWFPDPVDYQRYLEFICPYFKPSKSESPNDEKQEFLFVMRPTYLKGWQWLSSLILTWRVLKNINVQATHQIN